MFNSRKSSYKTKSPYFPIDNDSMAFCNLSYYSLSQRILTSYDSDGSDFCVIFRISKERAIVPYKNVNNIILIVIGL